MTAQNLIVLAHVPTDSVNEGFLPAAKSLGLAVIDALTQRVVRPVVIFSNSDHLQTSTSVAADYFGLPRKDRHTTYRAKNKAQMRVHLQAPGIDTLWHATVCDPAVVKPREGVASLQVSLARDRAQLQAQCVAVWADHPGRPMLIEDGPPHTLETLGDDKSLVMLVRCSTPAPKASWRLPIARS